VGQRILVTGGTGVLGRAVVERLLETGCTVRVASRRARPAGDGGRYEWAVVDLLSGRGAEKAMAGVDVVVHCASPLRGRTKEVRVACTVVDAAKRAGSPHVLYVSIVGVDRIPFGYYKGKLAAERLFTDSGLPHTILRATQFHDLVRTLFAATAKAPVMLVPGFGFQPIDVRDVADRLAELARGEPRGRVADIGGPQARQAKDLARSYLTATGRRRLVVPVRLPGATFRAFRQGGNLTAERVPGKITFEEYLAEHAEPVAVSYRGHRR